MIVKWHFLFLLALVSLKSQAQRGGDGSALIPDIKQCSFITTDKAIYNPGERVKFIVLRTLPGGTRVRYRHLDSVIADREASGSYWYWAPPLKDFTGYLVELYRKIDGKYDVLSSIAVDVSSDWSRYPRYGFLSKYGQLSKSSIEKHIDFLNRCHINGLQFYDWQSKHHEPLAGTVQSPAAHWKDIANRDTYLKTVREYISAAHQHHIKCLFYNLIYGALKDASPDSVSDRWYAYTDPQHKAKEVFRLPGWFVSDIYLLDPSNTGWQHYLAAQNKKVYQVLDFDGYHVDQLGNRDKNLYDFNGKQINLPSTFAGFIESMKSSAPDKAIVMNSVNQYGQPGLARSRVDFLYTEVWPPNDSFRDLSRIIKENDSLSAGLKKTVLTAYMDYKISENPGYFNSSGVLLTDAVIFSFGATHLELGEHMLGREYFPSDKLLMKEDLQKTIIRYYDFQVAYENLLENGGNWNAPDLRTSSPECSLAAWPAGKGKVAVIGRKLGNRQIIQLINFSQANSMEWRDSYGKQAEPKPIRNAVFSFTGSGKVKRIWYASPDHCAGIPVIIPFSKQAGDRIAFKLPYLKYWDMLVVDY